MSVVPCSADLAVLALLAGVLLMYFEANRPGSIFPGCAGLLCVLLTLHRLAGFPFNPQGLALLLAGLLLLAGGTGVMRGIGRVNRRLLTLLAGAAFSAGLWRVFAPAYQPHAAVAFVAGVLFVCVTQRLGRMALVARRLKRAGSSQAVYGSREAERARLDTYLSARKGVS